MEHDAPLLTVGDKNLCLEQQTAIRFEVEYKGEKRLLSGFADYTLRHSPTNLENEACLVICEGKPRNRVSTGLPQTLAYMGKGPMKHK